MTSLTASLVSDRSPSSLSTTPIRYIAATWDDFLALPDKRAGGPQNEDARSAIRVAADLQPGQVIRVLGHVCRIAGASWGCGIAISVRNSGGRRGIKFRIRHADGELWIARPPTDVSGDR